MKNKIVSNYITKSKMNLKFLIPSINKFTVTINLQKMREINIRFAHKFDGIRIFTESQDG